MKPMPATPAFPLPPRPGMPTGLGRRLWPVGVGFLTLALIGCQQVGPHQQRLVSKPNMEFSDSPVFSYQNKLTPQIEPGSMVSGGALASGCTSCK